MRHFRRYLPLVAAFSGGLVSMGLEIVAAREIHPVFGSSVFIWGGILTVFMTALGLGYYIGGRKASEYASRESIGRLLLSVAIMVGLIAIFTPRVLELGFSLSIPLRYRAIPVITVLFGPPAFLVGCISPYAAELADESLGVGDAAGRVYAAGTVGSIIGAAGTTFVLLPKIGVSLSYVLFTVVLLLGAVLLLRDTRDTGTWLRIGVICFLVLSQVAVISSQQAVVYETDTAYNHIEVRDSDSTRTLYMNGRSQSAEYLNGSENYVFDYTKAFHLSTVYRESNTESIDSVLLIGGGGGTVAERYAKEYDAQVDVIEIDPGIANAAETYFNTQHENVTWHIQDGRTFLRETDNEYDVIILDAFQEEGVVPYHLTTVEFFQLASSHLTEDGVFTANIIASQTGQNSGLYRSEIATTQTAFGSVDAYPLEENPRNTQNIVLVGWNGPQVQTETLRTREQSYSVGVPIRQFFSFREVGQTVDTSNATILRDDKGSTSSLDSEK